MSRLVDDRRDQRRKPANKPQDRDKLAPGQAKPGAWLVALLKQIRERRP